MITKAKFTTDTWITGKLDGLYVIGRTYILRDKQMVCVVSELATTTDISFNDLEDIKNLTITGQSIVTKKPYKPGGGLATKFMSEMTKTNFN